jgi:hypothetical protein
MNCNAANPNCVIPGDFYRRGYVPDSGVNAVVFYPPDIFNAYFVLRAIQRYSNFHAYKIQGISRSHTYMNGFLAKLLNVFSCEDPDTPVEQKPDFTAINMITGILMFVPGIGEGAMVAQMVEEFVESKIIEHVNTTAAALPSVKLNFGNFAEGFTQLLWGFDQALTNDITTWLQSECAFLCCAFY